MKTILTSLLSAGFLFSIAHAEFETWTNQAGNTARMELLEVVKDGNKVVGKFKLEDGRTIDLNANDLSEADATRLREWQPKPEIKSVFDEMLDGNLVQLDGRRLRNFDFSEKPEKFYIFYYTASWCPPCRAFTPNLVEFYERMKESHGNLFELILITSDRDASSMTSYARDAKMPWPQVRFSKAREVRGKLNHGVTGIPAVIVTDLEGNVLSRDRSLANIERILTQ